MSAPAPTTGSEEVTPARRVDKAELGVAVLLAVVGVVVVVDALGLDVPYSQSDPVGPRTVPYLVGALLLVCSVLLASAVVLRV